MRLTRNVLYAVALAALFSLLGAALSVPGTLAERAFAGILGLTTLTSWVAGIYVWAVARTHGKSHLLTIVPLIFLGLFCEWLYVLLRGGELVRSADRALANRDIHPPGGIATPGASLPQSPDSEEPVTRRRRLTRNVLYAVALAAFFSFWGAAFSVPGTQAERAFAGVLGLSTVTSWVAGVYVWAVARVHRNSHVLTLVVLIFLGLFCGWFYVLLRGGELVRAAGPALATRDIDPPGGMASPGDTWKGVE